jgi:hypothetical protein
MLHSMQIMPLILYKQVPALIEEHGISSKLTWETTMTWMPATVAEMDPIT